MSKVNWKDRGMIVDVVFKSRNRKQVLETLGLASRSGNYITLNKYLNFYNIDISHFETLSESVRSVIRFNTLPDSEVFIKNSTYRNGGLLKCRLIKGGYLEFICSKCSMGNIWNGEELVLQLDHKNGISNDNRVENLTLLCPNCHSQTKTYAGRNNRKKLTKKEAKRLREIENKKKIDFIIRKISSADIVFSKFGWVSKTAKIIGCKPQKVNQWMKRNMSNFYEEKCFKRKI